MAVAVFPSRLRSSVGAERITEGRGWAGAEGLPGDVAAPREVGERPSDFQPTLREMVN